MDNKELQNKEMADNVYKIISQIHYDIDITDKYTATVDICQIAQSYYEPKLAEKDAKIKEQAEQIEKLKGLLKEEFYADCHSKKPFVQLIADEENKKYDEYVDELWEEKRKQHGI